MTERPETVEIDRQKVTTMLHQLTVTRERETLSPVAAEHLGTATQWLDEALQDAEIVERVLVLEPQDDRAARRALEEYAGQTDDEELAQDLREWLASIYIERSDTGGDR